MRVLWSRLADRLAWRRREDDLASEVESHIALHVDDNISAGMTPAEARRRALVALGGVEVMKDRYRDRRGLPFVEGAIKDLRFAARMLRKNPGFATVAIVALAVGIGANVAIFSVANAFLIRPLPVADPDRVVRVATNTFSATSYGDYLEYRDGNRTLETLSAFTGLSLNLRVDDTPEHVFGMAVTGNYFAGLGVPVARGRELMDSDDRIGAPGALVLSDRVWRRRFAADPGVLGRQVMVNGQPYAVVGIAPPTFTGTMAPFAPEMWVPWNGPGVAPPGAEPRGRSAHVIGRMRPDASIEQAQADLSAVASSIGQRSPERGEVRVTVHPGRTVYPEGSQAVTVFIALLGVLAGLFLLIACINIANLLLARATARRREVAVRLALGAGRWRLVRQLVTESGLLAAIGTALGLVLAFAATRALVSLELPLPIPVELNLSFDWNIGIFAAAMTVLTTMLFGLVPAWQSSKVGLTATLKDGAPGGGRTRSRLRSTLVTAQVALSTLLLVTGGVLARSMASAEAIDPGFSTANVITAGLDFDAAGYTPERARVFLDQLLERLDTTPGVTAAHAAYIVPLTLSNSVTRFHTDGDDDAGARARAMVYFNQITPGHFETLRISLLAGRDFRASDRPGAAEVGIVNETLAQAFWPGQDPIGKRVRMGNVGGEGHAWVEVVGLVKNSKYTTIGEAPSSFLYRPWAQDFRPAVTLLVRTPGEPANILPTLRSILRSLDREVPLYNVSPLESVTAVSLLPVQAAALISGTLGLAALALAAIGLYGVMSYIVRQRTNEIGMYIALGATPGRVVNTITRQGMTWTVIGLVIGLAAAWMLTRLLTNLLYGVAATDGVAFVGIAAVLVATAYTACYVPARRASRVDPLIALRHE